MAPPNTTDADGTGDLPAVAARELPAPSPAFAASLYRTILCIKSLVNVVTPQCNDHISSFLTQLFTEALGMAPDSTTREALVQIVTPFGWNGTSFSGQLDSKRLDMLQQHVYSLRDEHISGALRERQRQRKSSSAPVPRVTVDSAKAAETKDSTAAPDGATEANSKNESKKKDDTTEDTTTTNNNNSSSSSSKKGGGEEAKKEKDVLANKDGQEEGSSSKEPSQEPAQDTSNTATVAAGGAVVAVAAVAVAASQSTPSEDQDDAKQEDEPADAPETANPAQAPGANSEGDGEGSTVDTDNSSEKGEKEGKEEEEIVETKTAVTVTPAEDAAEDKANGEVKKEAGGEEATVVTDEQRDKLKKKREFIAKELLETEKKYVAKLSTIQKLLVDPLRQMARSKKPLLSEMQISSVFGGLEELIGVNQTLLIELQAVYESVPDGAALGSVFIKMAPYLKFYTKYINNQSAVDGALRKCKKKTSFRTWLEQTLMDPEFRGLTLQALIQTPVRRIPLYELMFKDMVKNTESDHEHRATLVRALETIQETAVHVNDAVAAYDKRNKELEKILAIQESFVGTMVFVAPHRVFIYDGPLMKVCRKSTKKFHFFLFNDILVYAEKLSSNRFLYHRQLDLSDSRFDPVAGLSEGQYHFYIVNTEKSFEVVCSSKEDYDKWYNMLLKYSAESKARKATIQQEKEKRRGSERVRSVYALNPNARRQSVHPNAVGGAGEGATSRDSMGRPRDSLNSQGAGDDEFIAPVWAPDAASKACTLCAQPFTLVTRRHHCRCCGALICGNCSQHRMSLPNSKQVRVCDGCYFSDDRVDEEYDDEENEAKLIAIQEIMIGKIQVMKPGRKFFKAGPLRKVCRKAVKKFYFFLFDDVLMYAEKSSKVAKYEFHRKINLNTCKVADVESPPEYAFQIISAQKSFTVCCADEEEKGRWMYAFLRLLPNEEGKSNDGTLAPVWIPDSHQRECMMCAKKFTTFNRRHHCRVCGKVICGSCSGNKIRLAHISNKPVRACNSCIANRSSSSIIDPDSSKGSGSGGGGEEEGETSSGQDSPAQSPSSATPPKERRESYRPQPKGQAKERPVSVEL